LELNNKLLLENDRCGYRASDIGSR